MGTWDRGSFDNDDAADFVHEVAEDGADALREAFEHALDEDEEYLEVDLGARAIAAAEIVVAGLRGDVTRIAEPALSAWVTAQDRAVFVALRESAARAVTRVSGDDSELADLWTESDEVEPWTADMKRLLGELTG